MNSYKSIKVLNKQNSNDKVITSPKFGQALNNTHHFSDANAVIASSLLSPRNAQNKIEVSMAKMKVGY